MLDYSQILMAWHHEQLKNKRKEARAPVKKCGAVRRTGTTCSQPAGHGTEHPGYGRCKLHMGNTKQSNKKAALEMAQHEMLVMGLAIDVDPMEAILTCIRITAGEVVYCSDRVAELNHDEAVVKRNVSKSHAGDGIDGDWEEVEESNEAQLNIWIQARHQAMDRLVKFSKAAIDAGISERQVQVAEATGQAIGQLLHTVMAELNLTDKQKQIAPEVIQRNLRLLEAGKGSGL